MSKVAKKLVLILATSLSITRVSMEDILFLQKQVLSIYYLIWFKKNKVQSFN